MDTHETAPQGGGLPGALKILAMLMVVAMASIAAGVVLEIVPVPSATDAAVKIAALGGIAAATAVVLWALGRGNGKPERM
jgi:hypothetical protein